MISEFSGAISGAAGGGGGGGGGGASASCQYKNSALHYFRSEYCH